MFSHGLCVVRNYVAQSIMFMYNVRNIAAFRPWWGLLLDGNK